MLLIAFSAQCQQHTLTFTSTTDAKFFVYLNGVLQNKRSSGMVTLKSLEDKDYHIRIVIDDPFEVAVTRTIRPDPKHSEYTVHFNAVKERVYLKAAKTQREENQWIPNEGQEEATESESETNTQPKARPALRRHTDSDADSKLLIKHIRTQGE